MPTQKPRVTFTISKEQLAQVENFQYENRIKNQTQAILQLIERGLDDLTSSESTEALTTPELSSEAKILLPLFEQLDALDKGRVIGQTEGLLMHEKYMQKGQNENAG